MLVGYARTSTSDQVAGLEAQLRELQDAGYEHVYSEQVSSVAQRGQVDEALRYVRKGDTLVATKLDRLARSTQHLLKIVEGLEGKGVGLRILDFAGTDVDTKSPAGKMMLTMFAAMAQFERELMLERQREGIANAKPGGKDKGRDPGPRTKVEQAPAMNANGPTVSESANHI